MKGRRKRQLHQTPPEFAEAAEERAAFERSLANLSSWERQEEIDRRNRVVRSTGRPTRERGRLIMIDMSEGRLYECDFPKEYLAERRAKMLPRFRKQGFR